MLNHLPVKDLRAMMRSMPKEMQISGYASMSGGQLRGAILNQLKEGGSRVIPGTEGMANVQRPANRVQKMSPLFHEMSDSPAYNNWEMTTPETETGRRSFRIRTVVNDPLKLPLTEIEPALSRGEVQALVDEEARDQQHI